MAPAGGKLLNVWPLRGGKNPIWPVLWLAPSSNWEDRAKFFAATTLVQTLQQAKRQLLLPNTLKKLDRYDLAHHR